MPLIGFEQIIVAADLDAALQVFIAGAARQEDDGRPFAVLFELANPLRGLKAVHPGQNYIQQH